MLLMPDYIIVKKQVFGKFVYYISPGIKNKLPEGVWIANITHTVGKKETFRGTLGKIVYLMRKKISFSISFIEEFFFSILVDYSISFYKIIQSMGSLI
jgi:hypothetical protein